MCLCIYLSVCLSVCLSWLRSFAYLSVARINFSFPLFSDTATLQSAGWELAQGEDASVGQHCREAVSLSVSLITATFLCSVTLNVVLSGVQWFAGPCLCPSEWVVQAALWLYTACICISGVVATNFAWCTGWVSKCACASTSLSCFFQTTRLVFRAIVVWPECRHSNRPFPSQQPRQWLSTALSS